MTVKLSEIEKAAEGQVPRCQSRGAAVDLDDPLLIKWAED